MIKISIPATSANLGPGFDCLGIALSIYNYYYVEKADKMQIDGIPDYLNNEKNLFNVSFMKAMKFLNKKGSFKLKVKSNIPISRGLGSSANVIVAGIKAANILYADSKKQLTNQQVFELATSIEGHPDNIAPALFGSLQASLFTKNKLFHKKLPVSSKLHFTILIPPFKTSTSIARTILPKYYKKECAVSNISHSIMMCEALKDGDIELIKEASVDYIHEPYRKTLIKGYEKIKKECLSKGAYVVLISGSGPCLLCISGKKNFSKEINLDVVKDKWEAKDVYISK